MRTWSIMRRWVDAILVGVWGLRQHPAHELFLSERIDQGKQVLNLFIGCWEIPVDNPTLLELFFTMLYQVAGSIIISENQAPHVRNLFIGYRAMPVDR